jgi:WD repeat-containing protein 35
LNISQEGKSDVEFLREEELLAGLQKPTRSYKPVTCYQITKKGVGVVKKISRKDKEIVHELVYMRGSRELLAAEWDGNDYWLESNSGYRRKSTITDTEDVSYVSSAYVPQCLRYGGRPTLSNAHRAHESAVNTNQIRDNLDEVITLNSVSIIVAEYIPFGANQIVQLNNNVGSTERCQGGFISPDVDDAEGGTSMTDDHDLTAVDILDYTLTHHINFEAEIRFHEEGGVVQVETFGVSLNAEGTCFYGMQVEAVMDRIKDNISLDHLARLLVDVQQDSSAIVDSIISEYQRELMQLIFLGDACNRNKVNLIIANEITPHLTAEEYMDKGEYENELKQVIGDTKAAYDISEHDTLIFGAYGLLVCGPNSRHHEPLLCAYLQFITIDIFVQNYFARMWILSADMATTNKIIDVSESDPTSLNRIRYRICKLARDIIQMDEILGYLLEALEIIEIPPEPPEQAGRSLYERLEISGMRSQLVRRTTDLKKNIAGSQRYLDVLRERAHVVSENKMFNLNENLESNSKKLCMLQDYNSESAHSLYILQVMFAGMLAFDVLDRLTGNWTVANAWWMQSFVESMMKGTPGVFFGFSMLFWAIFAWAILKSFEIKNWRSQGMITIKQRMHRKIYVEKLRDLLLTKGRGHEEMCYDSDAPWAKDTVKKDIVKLTYEEKDPREWGNSRPKVVIEYDARNQYLLEITMTYNKRTASKNLGLNAQELREKFLGELEQLGIYDVEGEDHSADDLAVDKRIAIELRMQEAEENGEEEEGGE